MDKDFTLISTPDKFKVIIKKDLEVSISVKLMLGFYSLFLISVVVSILVSFIVNRMTIRMPMPIIVGLFIWLIFWSTKHQYKTFLLPLKGKDELLIMGDTILFESSYWKLKKRFFIEIKDIKKMGTYNDPKGLVGSMASQMVSMFFSVKYNAIYIYKSKRKQIIIGQSLEKEDFEKLHKALEEWLATNAPQP
jgi:hypothetical protein